MRIFPLLFVTAASIGAFAGEMGNSAPVTGILVADDSRSIRPILGMVPGAAYAGQPSVSDADFAVAAPGGHTALVSRDGNLYIVRRLDGQLPVWRQLDDAKPGGPAAWSNDANSLAMVSPDGMSVDLWVKSETGDLKHASNIDLSYLGEDVAALAVDSQARYAILTTRTEQGGTLYLLKPGQMPRMLLPLERSGTLLLGSDVLFVSDQGRSEVLRVSDWDGTMQVTTVASPGHGVNKPVGIAVSRDAKTLYVASAENRQVVAVDARTGAVRHNVELEFMPTRLESLAGGAYLLLDAGVAGEIPAQAMDVRTLKVFFIPVGAYATKSAD